MDKTSTEGYYGREDNIEVKMPKRNFSNDQAKDKSKKKKKDREAKDLKLFMYGGTKSLNECAYEFSEKYYPNIGLLSYRVPPVYFNQQNVTNEPEQTQSKSTQNGQSPTDYWQTNKLFHATNDTEKKRNVLIQNHSKPLNLTNSSRNSLTIETSSPLKETKAHCQQFPVNSSDEFDSGIECKAMPTASHFTSDSETKSEKIIGQDDQSQNQIRKPSQETLQQFLQKPQESQIRRDKALSLVLDKLEEFGKSRDRLGEIPIFIISNISYDHYLNKLPARVANAFNVHRPRDVTRRGQLDILVLHAKAGAILIQVKAVGEYGPVDPSDSSGSWRPTEEDTEQAIVRMVGKAVKQLDRDKKVFRHVLQDLDNVPSLTKVVALPYVDKHYLNKILPKLSTVCSEAIQFLCKDDLIGSELSSSTALEQWWNRTFDSQITEQLNTNYLKIIVGRVCGLLSSFRAQPNSRSQVEVRNYGQAVSETAVRMTSNVIRQEHWDIVQSPEMFVILKGPAGGGKTSVLILKARQWLDAGKRVIILNTGLLDEGLPKGYALQDAINGRALKQDGLKAERLDLGLSKFNQEQVREKIKERVSKIIANHSKQVISQSDVVKSEKDLVAEEKTGQVIFVLDEVFWCSSVQSLVKLLPSLELTAGVWLTTSTTDLGELEPKYKVISITNVTRLPPAVQRLLMKLKSPNKSWEQFYTANSAESGLATNGPLPVFIHHDQHTVSKAEAFQHGDKNSERYHCNGDENGQLAHTDNKDEPEYSNKALSPLNCEKCAETVSHFLHELVQQSMYEECPTLGKSQKESSSEKVGACTTSNLNFRDIVILTDALANTMNNNCRNAEGEKNKQAYDTERNENKHRNKAEDDRKNNCVERKNAIWAVLKESLFVKQLKERNVPVKTFLNESQDIATHKNHNGVVCTDVFMGRGLERKVVVFLPFLTSDYPESMTEGCFKSTDKPLQESHREPTIKSAVHSLDNRSTYEIKFEEFEIRENLSDADEESFTSKHSHDYSRSEFDIGEGSAKKIKKQTDIDSDISSVDQLLTRMSEDNQNGLHQAASCCVSQLIVIIP